MTLKKYPDSDIYFNKHVQKIYGVGALTLCLLMDSSTCCATINLGWFIIYIEEA